MLSPRPLFLAALAAAGLLGCIDITTDPTPATTPAEGTPVGLVAIDYAATSDGDLVADGDPTADHEASRSGVAAAGLHIALDSTFLLAPNDRRGMPTELVLVTADPRALVLGPDGRAHAIKAGAVGVVAQGRDGVAIDFLNLTVRTVAAVAIKADGPLPSRVGDSVVLAARSIDDTNTRLSGSLAYTWASSDPSILELVPTSLEPGSRVRALARAEGRVTISVTGKTVSSTLALEVRP
jgi:hypothetical protein